jgi:hypothetical protein
VEFRIIDLEFRILEMKFRIGDLKLLSVDSKIRITQMKFRIADWARGKSGGMIYKCLYYKHLRHSPALSRSQHGRPRIDFDWYRDLSKRQRLTGSSCSRRQ